MCLLADRALLIPIRYSTEIGMSSGETYKDHPYSLAMQMLYRYTLPWKRISYRLLPVEVYDTFCSLWRHLDDAPKLTFEEIPDSGSGGCPIQLNMSRCWMQRQLIFDPNHPSPTDHLRVVLTRPSFGWTPVEVLSWIDTPSKSCANLCQAPLILGAIPHTVGSNVTKTCLDWKVSSRTEFKDCLSRSGPSPDDRTMIKTQRLDITTYTFGEPEWSWSNCFVPTTK